MVNTILGRKLGMTQVWDEDDNVVPVTVVLAGPCTVSQVKTKATDGYDAVQIGFGDISAKHVNKPMAGHFAAAGVEPMRYLREVRVPEGEEHATGEKVTVADFADVQTVDVTGTSKGKGFQGTIKRWNFSRGPMAHGSRNQREPGSIGQCAYPARVRKGLHMAGHMGNERVTVKNLKLVRVDAEQNLMLIKGAVPGGKNALVSIRMA
ncbi:50S ribosomal protein L3 [Parafannyhessea umbonata]|jgi:large subunit ribosomal protein L3|uniref:Large ribosomal subunit protein uL3 n=1 Tax=Parafannyhessea umbonata TaxID=604330 RepID=A0A6N7WVA5_9ACTN|nr:50S ribosomal protein L3 [Parafannyhessea umbonata]MCI6681232.1 50S ribosomal protein L3 [Parafannyhessea umbonata]MCI7218332.1 50S ribosomal protein L3 [Parafannyhessea umbonata]MDD6359513.1 50S ribosomal protein L3 [Parafannyhessea umbonata]MDD6566611.1 50S ribosomal protein L3 [Parafannyhessea umbonata]MDD6602669.1 50S ribosomal protein L3 [Parafannyhessea umbonata]